MSHHINGKQYPSMFNITTDIIHHMQYIHYELYYHKQLQFVEHKIIEALQLWILVLKQHVLIQTIW